MKEKTLTLIILHVAVFLAGWTGIFGRLVSLDGLPLVWYRMMTSVVVLAAVLGFMRKLHKTPMRAVLKIGGCGILLALHWVAFFASIQASNVSIGVACVATSCFFTTLFEPLVNRKRIQWKNILLSFIAIAGILFIFSVDVRFRLGIVLGLLCAALYSLFAILNVNIANETKEDSATMLLYELAGGVAFLTLCIPVFRAIYPTESVVPVGNDLLSLLLLGSVFTVIPFLFQLQALRKLSAFTVNMAYNLEPLYSIAVAAVLFGELQEVGFSFWVGICLIVLSVVLQTYSVVRAKDEGKR
ncbi:MAG: DMT family transporter [Rikenellaceae bacterium]|nr:DMT family transporter [Rikenellaceae bacterium]